ncbi:MAG: glycosyltransferase family 4 protein [Candidatus Rokubacteria bacterium]|nr:glycosyltransferase family 4 protein [Candidatus Rokubacteria bacterium]
MDRIRVLHIITRLIVGGAQENTLLTVEGLHARPQYSVGLMVGSDRGPEGNLMARARAGGFPLLEVPELIRAPHPVKDLVTLAKIARAIREGGYQIVHTHSTKAGLLGRLAARWMGTPIVVHTLHSLAFHPYQPWVANRGLRIMKRWLAPCTDHFISVSDAVRQGAMAAGIGRPEQHSTIYSGMEMDRFLSAHVDREAVRRSLGIPPDAPVVGKVARLFHLKGHAELLPALPAVVRAVPDVRILLVGDGILQPTIREEARRLGILDHLVFTGLVEPERIPDLLAAMDVVVHTSLREGLARVLPQALAVGKPVVAFDLDGTPEVVLPGVTGTLVRPGDTDGLARALIALLRDPGLRERMGRNGREVVAPQFGAEVMVERIHQVYVKLLEAKGLSAPTAG